MIGRTRQYRHCDRAKYMGWCRPRLAQARPRREPARFGGRIDMTRCGAVITAIGVAFSVLTAPPAGAFDRRDVDVLAVLPDVTPGQPSSVEGLTVGPDGNIYVPSFGFNTTGALTGNAALFVISPNGMLVRKVAIANSSPHMLGLRFNPVNGFLLVLDFGAGLVLHVDPATGASSVFMTPTIGGAGLNALTFDKLGNVYVSDSFNGVIWKVGPNGGAPTVWSNSPLLGPGTGLTPPFGANGVEFSNDGKVLAKLGDFNGFDKDGVASGLLFPASLAFSLDGKKLYVSNLTLFLPFAG